MFMPGRYSEIDVVVGYIDQQLDAIRASAYGLTEKQARATPCRSELSIGGLLKHATYFMNGAGSSDASDEDGYASFALGVDETLVAALDAFDAAREAYLAELRTVDPAAESISGPAPWDGIDEPMPSVRRYGLVHHIEELARHAGHADVIREQIDGATAASLLMAVEGRPGERLREALDTDYAEAAGARDPSVYSPGNRQIVILVDAGDSPRRRGRSIPVGSPCTKDQPGFWQVFRVVSRTLVR